MSEQAEEQDQLEQEHNAIDRERNEPLVDLLKEAYKYCDDFNYSPSENEDSLGTQIGQIAGRINIAIIKIEAGLW